MKYHSKITSKGTITIAAPLRKALGLKTGQEVGLELNKDGNRILMDPGLTVEQFEKARDEMLSRYSKRHPLMGQELREAAGKSWISARKK